MSRRLSGIQVGDWVDAGARHCPSLTAFVDGDARERSFDETQRRVHQLAHALVERGVQPNDRLAILAIDSAEFIETFFAAAKIGATVVPLNYRLQQSEIELVSSRCDPTHIFVSERYEQTAHDVVTQLSEPCAVISYDGTEAEPFEDLIGDGREPFRRRQIGDDTGTSTRCPTSLRPRRSRAGRRRSDRPESPRLTSTPSSSTTASRLPPC